MRTLLIIFLMTLTACNPLKLQAPACQNKNEPGETCTKMVKLKTCLLYTSDAADE